MSGKYAEMRVFNVQPFDYLGSIQLRSLRVAEALQKFGVETVFLVPQTKDSTKNLFSRVAISKGFRVYQTGSVRPLFVKDFLSLQRLLEFFASFPRTVAQMYKLFKTEKPDVVHVNGFVCIQEALATYLFHRKKRCWVLISNLYPRLFIFFFGLLIRGFDRIFVSRTLIHYYFGRGEDMTIYEPVDADFFNPDHVNVIEKKRILKKFELSEASPIIVSTAMVSPQKGLEFLIAAIQKLKKEFSQIKLVIIGDIIPSQKYYYLTLKKMVARLGLEHKVVFTRYIPVEELRALLALADIFALSSIREGTPVSILEAMAMEKVVVASDVGGVSEQIVNNETGLLVPPKNPCALADAIMFLLHNKRKKAKMEKQARKRALLMFSLKRCVQQYWQYYISET